MTFACSTSGLVKVSVRSSRDSKKICPILFGGFDGEVLGKTCVIFVRMSFPAQVPRAVSSSIRGDLCRPSRREAGSPRRPPEAASRTGGRCSSASGGGHCAAARSAGAQRRGPGGGSSRSVGTAGGGAGRAARHSASPPPPGSRPARQLDRMDAAVAREEPPAGGRQSEVPHPARKSPARTSSPSLPVDWAERYNTTPVLIETFVETPRICLPGFRLGPLTY